MKLACHRLFSGSLCPVCVPGRTSVFTYVGKGGETHLPVSHL